MYLCLCDRLLIEVKYNKNNQLGILNGDHVRLIEVTVFNRGQIYRK